MNEPFWRGGVGSSIGDTTTVLSVLLYSIAMNVRRSNISSGWVSGLVWGIAGFIVYVVMPKNALVISRQHAGPSLYIRRVSLAEGGFVVAREPADRGGRVAGASEFLPTGTNTNVFLDLSPPSWGEPWLPGNRLTVVLYKDFGDRVFDEKADVPVQTMLGGPYQQHIIFR